MRYLPRSPTVSHHLLGHQFNGRMANAENRRLIGDKMFEKHVRPACVVRHNASDEFLPLSRKNRRSGRPWDDEVTMLTYLLVLAPPVLIQYNQSHG